MLRKVETNNVGCDVRVDGDHIAVTGLSLYDAELAAYVGDQPEVDRPAVVERGLKNSPGTRSTMGSPQTGAARASRECGFVRFSGTTSVPQSAMELPFSVV